MLTRVMKARTGRANIYADLSLPPQNGIKRAPIINIAGRGIRLLIVVLISLNEKAQYFCHKNKEYTGDKAIDGKKFCCTFPRELRMLLDKKSIIRSISKEM